MARRNNLSFAWETFSPSEPTHREKVDPQVESRLYLARRITYHTRFLRQVAKSTPRGSSLES